MKAMQRSRTSLLIDDVAARLWDQSAQHDAAPDATSINLARLIDYFGKTKPLTEIDHTEAKRMVAWRRGHRVKGRADAPLISHATVNRSVTKVLHRLFTFAKSEGAVFDREPKWGDLLLDEPVERVRELQDDEAAAFDDAMRDDYGPFFAFVRASGLRQRECVTLMMEGGQLRHPADRSHRQGRTARGVPHHRHHPRDTVPATGPASGLRVHLCRDPQQQGPSTRPALPAHPQRTAVGMVADARQGGRQGLPLSRLPT